MKATLKIRDRIKELRRVPAAELVVNQKNWRHHPERQRAAMRATLAEIGYADALLAREDDAGRLVLIDGHLRAETTPGDLVPVLVLDVTALEADKLLATLDPLAGMAKSDEVQLQALLSDLAAENDELTKLVFGDAELAGSKNGDVPASFREYGEDIKTDHRCPKCGYEWG